MFSLILVTASFGIAADDVPQSAAKELARLEGAWVYVAGEEVGHVLPPEVAKKEGIEFVFKGDTLVVKKKGRVREEFTVTIDPSQNPREMDLKFSKGENQRKVCLAIYALEGDRLTICTATKLRPTPGEKRPKVFSTKKSDEAATSPGLLLFHLERQK